MKVHKEIRVTLKKRGEPIRAVAEALSRTDAAALARWEGEGGALVPESASRGNGGNWPEILSWEWGSIK